MRQPQHTRVQAARRTLSLPHGNAEIFLNNQIVFTLFWIYVLTSKAATNSQQLERETSVQSGPERTVMVRVILVSQQTFRVQQGLGGRIKRLQSPLVSE